MPADLLADPTIRAWARLLKAQKLLLEGVQAALSEAGLPPLEWYDVLIELKTAPDQRLRLFDLGERIVLSRSNLTRLLDRLEKEGLVTRDNCSEDRRGLYAVLTPAGLAMQKRMWPVYQTAIQNLFGRHYDARDAAQLADLLERPISAPA
ncbi:MarR family transcriptional regulator [Permianibacter sp. IMCC34836]|uniref:MarR family winged helix-turn-helix transcriptional regulator n=1 Tax=Permianibacter fluminis TaxID=2738515 RepID=UPI001555D81D|nr:MarR family transcriptional regulator [Permianibacter fluminis]NQD37610.1 MarR family transcriptional regulator [Permianibacter fluminis]